MPNLTSPDCGNRRPAGRLTGCRSSSRRAGQGLLPPLAGPADRRGPVPLGAPSLQILAADGLPVLELPQSPQRTTPATTGLYEAVVNGTVTHSGDPRLARHVANETVRTDNRGTLIYKEHKHSTRRIPRRLRDHGPLGRRHRRPGAAAPLVRGCELNRFAKDTYQARCDGHHPGSDPLRRLP
jgi:hypothetical protein